jgi:hypothetical protein
MFKNQIIFLVSYGFSNNPKLNRDYQEWHLDYTKDVYTVFIPLVNFNTKNSLQYIKKKINNKGNY